MSDFEPINDLEKALERTLAQLMPRREFLGQFYTAQIMVPSREEVQSDGKGFKPVLFDKDGTPMVAAGTAPERLRSLADMAPWYITVYAGAFMRDMPLDHGLIVNPGIEGGSFDLSPAGVGDVIARFSDKKLGE